MPGTFYGKKEFKKEEIIEKKIRTLYRLRSQVMGEQITYLILMMVFAAQMEEYQAAAESYEKALELAKEQGAKNAQKAIESVRKIRFPGPKIIKIDRLMRFSYRFWVENFNTVPLINLALQSKLRNCQNASNKFDTTKIEGVLFFTEKLKKNVLFQNVCFFSGFERREQQNSSRCENRRGC